MFTKLIACFFATWSLSIASAFAQSPSPFQGPSDLYFLAVGFGNHQDKDYSALGSARNSANVVANALLDAGAKYGIVLTSEPESGNYFTREDFWRALTKLKKQIRSDGTRTPRVVVYIMTHGAGDPASDYLFLIPDNLIVAENPLTQELVFRMARRSIFNVDLLASLMSFRLDVRMEHLDHSLKSDALPEALGFQGMIEQLNKRIQRSAELDRIATTYGGSTPLDNAPIPFVLLLDNCTNGIKPNLVGRNIALSRLVSLMYSATLDVGRVFYAVKPGLGASSVVLPNRLTSDVDLVSNSEAMVSPNVGPLAVHLKNALADRTNGDALTLVEFSQRIEKSGSSDLDVFLPPQPYMPTAPLRSDVGHAEFIPNAGGTRGQLERLSPSGQSLVFCCKVVSGL